MAQGSQKRSEMYSFRMPHSTAVALQELCDDRKTSRVEVLRQLIHEGASRLRPSRKKSQVQS